MFYCATCPIFIVCFGLFAYMWSECEVHRPMHIFLLDDSLIYYTNNEVGGTSSTSPSHQSCRAPWLSFIVHALVVACTIVLVCSWCNPNAFVGHSWEWISRKYYITHGESMPSRPLIGLEMRKQPSLPAHDDIIGGMLQGPLRSSRADHISYLSIHQSMPWLPHKS